MTTWSFLCRKMRVAPERPDHSEQVGVALSQNPVTAVTASTVTLYSADGLIAVQVCSLSRFLLFAARFSKARSCCRFCRVVVKQLEWKIQMNAELLLIEPKYWYRVVFKYFKIEKCIVRYTLYLDVNSYELTVFFFQFTFNVNYRDNCAKQYVRRRVEVRRRTFLKIRAHQCTSKVVYIVLARVEQRMSA